MSGHRRAAIIANPTAGRRRVERVQALAEGLQARGIATTVAFTTRPAHATELAREAAARGVDIVVSAGGDGTLNEVVQGLAGAAVSLAVWPGGTENVVARDIGMPRDAGGAADVVARGATAKIALGCAVSGDRRRYFLMFAGIGLDSAICLGVNPAIKRRFGTLAYWLSAARSIVTWSAAPSFRVDTDGGSYEAVFALVAKGRGYGGGFRFALTARLDDPRFEVFILPRRSSNIAYLPDVVACQRGVLREGMTRLMSRHVHADAREPVWVNLEGEVIGRLPMGFEIVPDALRLVVP